MHNPFDRKARQRQLAARISLIVMLAGTLSAVLVSAIELTKQFTWTHTTPGTAVMSGVTVILINLAFVASHAWSDNRALRSLATFGVLLLTSVEVLANYIQGGSAAIGGRIPEESLAFTGGSEQGLAQLAALLFAAVIPILTLLCSLCLTHFLKQHLAPDEPAAVNPFAAAALASDPATRLNAELEDILARSSN